ncbi:hypothetical protein [Geodermatophilus sp. SYSU D00815]
MTEPTPPDDRAERPTPDQGSGAGRFAELAERPVAEHVGVFEAEHDRLARELGTIDQL